MKKTLLLPLFVLFGLLVMACAKVEVTDNRNASTPALTSSTPASTPATVAAGDKTGVPECDDFITKYDACVADKVPEVTRAQYRTAIEQWRSTWRQLAANPNTKATLIAACKQAIEQSRVSMKAYNCSF